MFTICLVVSVLLALMTSLSAILKLTRHPRILASREAVGFPEAWLPRLAGVELLGAAGVAIGLAVPVLGIAAGIGLVVYFVAAIGSHVRAGDRAGVGSPVPFLVLAVAAVVLRAITV